MENAIVFLILPKFNNFNIGTVNVIQKKFLEPHKMGEHTKRLLLLTLLR